MWPPRENNATTDDSTDTARDNDLTQHLPKKLTPSQPSPTRVSAPVATKLDILTCVVSEDGNTLTTNNGTVYKLRRKNNKFSTYVCAYSCLKASPSTGCGKQIRLYPNGECSPVGDDKHIFENCYRLSDVKPPSHLLSNAPKVVSIVEKMQKLTDELTLDKDEKRLKKKIWSLVRKLRDPFLETNTLFVGLNEIQVNSRITQVKKEYYNENNKVRQFKKDHAPPSEGGTGLLQTSLSLYNWGAVCTARHSMDC